MRTGGARNGVVRAVSAVAVLALIFASVVGAYAHAGAHGFGAKAHVDCDVHHDGTASTDCEWTAVPSSGAGHAHEHGNDEADHATSCDFVCHGGVAILPVSALAPISHQTNVSPPAARGDDPRLKTSLERPPRSSVSV